MGLRELAEADLGVILEDDNRGFGWSITVTDPDGNTGDLTGSANDIAQVIDPDTGQAVSGRSASVALRVSSLTEECLGLPKGIADSGSKPWIVEFEDISGNTHKFKVAQSNPDRMIGLVVCLLEIYK